jgi:hypothetical protein
MADENKEAVQIQEPLPSDVVAFCALLARIMVRCLKEKNPQVMELLSLPSQPEQEETGGTHDAA